jgi:hypothetical protein
MKAMRGTSSGRPYRARCSGTCNACGKRFNPGDMIYGQGKGYGAVHNRCLATAGLVTRTMTAEEVARQKGG